MALHHGYQVIADIVLHRIELDAGYVPASGREEKGIAPGIEAVTVEEGCVYVIVADACYRSGIAGARYPGGGVHIGRIAGKSLLYAQPLLVEDLDTSGHTALRSHPAYGRLVLAGCHSFRGVEHADAEIPLLVHALEGLLDTGLDNTHRLYSGTAAAQKCLHVGKRIVVRHGRGDYDDLDRILVA